MGYLDIISSHWLDNPIRNGMLLGAAFIGIGYCGYQYLCKGQETDIELAKSIKA